MNQKHTTMTDDELLLETDYTSYANSCRDPHITSSQDLVECRRQNGHDDTHATRAGIRAIRWHPGAENLPLAG